MSAIRMKIREKVRDAVWASAHALVTIVRIVRNRETEQCREKARIIRPPTESSVTLLGTLARIPVTDPSIGKTTYDMHPCVEGMGGNRGELGGKGFRCRSSQPRMESNMVARSDGNTRHRNTGETMRNNQVNRVVGKMFGLEGLSMWFHARI